MVSELIKVQLLLQIHLLLPLPLDVLVIILLELVMEVCLQYRHLDVLQQQQNLLLNQPIFEKKQMFHLFSLVNPQYFLLFERLELHLHEDYQLLILLLVVLQYHQVKHLIHPLALQPHLYFHQLLKFLLMLVAIVLLLLFLVKVLVLLEFLLQEVFLYLPQISLLMLHLLINHLLMIYLLLV